MILANERIAVIDRLGIYHLVDGVGEVRGVLREVVWWCEGFGIPIGFPGYRRVALLMCLHISSNPSG